MRRVRKARAGALFMFAPYFAAMLFCGLIPLVVAIREVANPSWINMKGSYTTIYRILGDFRVIPALAHAAFLLAIFVPAMIVVVLAISLLLDATPVRGNTLMRLVLLLPGIVSGGVATLIWTSLLGPNIQWNGSNIRWLIGGIAFTSGVGSWIVIQYGSLRSISHEVLEAALVDGCNRFQLAIRIKLPMISRYIGYMTILLVAGAIQIYSEPTLLMSTGLTTDWSLSQVAYSYAFRTGDFAGGTALSLDMLIPNIVLGIVFVMNTDFLKRGERH
ncbi:MAG: sugar ABC transporter permease [Actinobacteria bacterium]|nr:sugar ABC transporter permease [Actinomycetota bacterium]